MRGDCTLISLVFCWPVFKAAYGEAPAVSFGDVDHQRVDEFGLAVVGMPVMTLTSPGRIVVSSSTDGHPVKSPRWRPSR
jgi:hypothetical protein